MRIVFMAFLLLAASLASCSGAAKNAAETTSAAAEATSRATRAVSRTAAGGNVANSASVSAGSAAKHTTRPPSTVYSVLSASDRAWIQADLNSPACNGFVTRTFSSPAAADLNWILYAGAGLGEPIPAAEKQDLIKNYHMPELENADSRKMPAPDVNAFLQKRLGLPLSRFPSGAFTFPYVKKYDAYYCTGTGTNFTAVTCVSGYKQRDGLFVVTVQSADQTVNPFVNVVSFKVVDTYYRFISCVPL